LLAELARLWADRGIHPGALKKWSTGGALKKRCEQGALAPICVWAFKTREEKLSRSTQIEAGSAAPHAKLRQSDQFSSLSAP
jgi:hypothetical protein